METCVGSWVLFEHLLNNCYGVGVDAKDNGTEWLALLENESVFAQGMACFEQSFDFLGGRVCFVEGLGECVDAFGGRLVVFQMATGAFILTFRRSSSVHLSCDWG